MKDIGQMIGQGWENTKVLSTGSYGQVLEIQREHFGATEKAALKVISVSAEKEKEAIIQEYTRMKTVKGHSNVVGFDELICEPREDGTGWDICIMLELMKPLMKWNNGALSEEDVVRLGKEICAGLSACHKNGIVHGDVKPESIFLSDNGDFKLGDFGIAKISGESLGNAKLGACKFMAPEVYNGQSRTAGADVYSLGLVMYWLLNEHRGPFLPLPPQGYTVLKEENALKRRCSGEKLPPPLNGSKALKAIVLKACACDPRERFESAEEMRKALERMREPAKPLPVKKIAVAAAALSLVAAIGLFALGGDKEKQKDTGKQEGWSDVQSDSSTLPVPSRFEVSREGIDTVKITWNAVPGADFYELYRSEDPKNGFEKVGVYTDETLEKVQTGLPFGKTFFYRLRVYRVVDDERQYSQYTNVEFAELNLGVPAVAVAEEIRVPRYTFHANSCSWLEANEHAAARGGHLASIDSVEEFEHLVAEIERLGMGDKYFFIGGTRAENSTDYYWVGSDGTQPVNGEASALAGLWLPGEPSYGYGEDVECFMEIHADPDYGWGLNDVKNQILSYSPKSVAYIVEYDNGGSNGLKITWDEVEGADFYELYRSADPEGEFEKLGVYDSNTLSKIDTKIESGVEYYYKVRAYRAVDGEKMYGEYSQVQSCAATQEQAVQFGWRLADGKWSYRGEDGAALSGWQEIGGKRYFFEGDGSMHTRWLEQGDTAYYLGVDGVVCTQWQEIDGKFFYFGDDGIKRTGWLKMGDYFYYLGDDGAMRTGWQEVDGKEYYIRDDGIMYTGWVEFEEGYYYFGTDGAKRTGEHVIDGKTYFFDETGLLIE